MRGSPLIHIPAGPPPLLGWLWTNVEVFGVGGLDQTLHDHEFLVLHVEVPALVDHALRVLSLLPVNPAALSVQALLVLPLLVVDVLLESRVHLQSRIVPVLNRVVGPTCHELSDQRPLFTV